MKRYLTPALAVFFAAVVIAGIIFVVSTVRGQSVKTESISAQEFLEYEKYGLRDTSGTAVVQKLLEDKNQDGEISNEVVLEALAGSLPDGGKLVSAEILEGTLTLDYVAEEGNVYLRRVVLSYDQEGLQKVSIREDRQMVTVDRSGTKEMIQLS